MMDHEAIEGLIPAYALGAVDLDESRAVEEHLRACATCRGLLVEYRELGGDLGTVQRFIRQAAAVSHVELTTLIVPGKNDSADEIRALAGWVASIDPEIPLHVTRFFPHRRCRALPPTDPAVVLRLCEAARESLHWVYAGNL